MPFEEAEYSILCAVLLRSWMRAGQVLWLRAFMSQKAQQRVHLQEAVW